MDKVDYEDKNAKVIGKDIFFIEPIGQNCPDCGDSYMNWKVGEETILKGGHRAVVEVNDIAQLIFKITEPGEYLDFRLHYNKGRVN